MFAKHVQKRALKILQKHGSRAFSISQHTSNAASPQAAFPSHIAWLQRGGGGALFGITNVRHMCSGGEEEDKRDRVGGGGRRMLVVQPRLKPEHVQQSKLLEALALADSLDDKREDAVPVVQGQRATPSNYKFPYLIVQNPLARSSVRADKYFGRGTVEDIKIHLDNLDSQEGIEAVFVNAMLSGIQQRNLEREWHKPVLDRVGLIIEIFSAHAKTKEAKLQAELAALMYRKSRLVRTRGTDGRLTFGVDGEAEVVSGKGRGSGGRGFISGAGETELQLQRRRNADTRRHMLGEIEDVRRTRALHRASRRRHSNTFGVDLPTVAVVGYTNAGKSSLVSALSNSNIYIDDKLFATLDPRVRKIVLPSGRKVLLSDTVGFISDLPLQLVRAFRATLEEVAEADLLMHVIDSSAANSEEQRTIVLKVLEQIGVSPEKLENIIEVWNKVDLLEDGHEASFAAEESLESGNESDLSEEEEMEEEEKELKGREKGEVKEGVIVEEEMSLESPPESEITAPNASDDEEFSEESSLEPIEEDSSVNIETEDTNDQVDPLVSTKKLDWNAENIVRVQTSAITGKGLEELLCLIDEKIKPIAEDTAKPRDIFNTKWRPPQNPE